MMTKTAAKRQRNGRCHNDSYAPTEADDANDHHDGKSDKELQHELIHGFADVYCLIRHFAETDACRQVGGNLLLFGNKGFAEVQTVPALLHHDAEKQGRLAIMTNKKGCGIFVSALYIGNIRELESAPGCHDWRVPNLLKIVERAIQANVNLLSFRIDRSRWGDRILANQRIENISCAYSQRSQPCVRELDKDTFRPFSNDVNLLYTGNLKNPLPKSFCFTRKLARRKAWSLDRVECERHIRVLIIDEGTVHTLRQLVCFVA